MGTTTTTYALIFHLTKPCLNLTSISSNLDKEAGAIKNPCMQPLLVNNLLSSLLALEH